MNAPIDLSNVILKTDRLTLRPFCQSDLDDLFEYASVDGVGQMAGWKPHENIAESQIILDMFINEKKTFALDMSGKVIGSVGIERYNEDLYAEFVDKKAREIGYVLSKDYWGQGLMPEAVNEVIRYCFEDLGLDMLFCGHSDLNKQSARVQQKCGFHFCKTYEYETRIGTIASCIGNILTKEEWLSRKI